MGLGKYKCQGDREGHRASNWTTGGRVNACTCRERRMLTSFCPLLVHDPVTTLATTDRLPRFYLIFSAAVLDVCQTVQQR